MLAPDAIPGCGFGDKDLLRHTDLLSLPEKGKPEGRAMMSSTRRIRTLMARGSLWRLSEEMSSSALLVGLGLLLLVAAITTYQSWDTAYRSALARGANEMRVASLELINALQAEEIAAREFLVTGDDGSLAGHARSEESLRGKLANLVALTDRAGRHGDVVKTIADQIAARSARFRQVVNDRRTTGLDAAFNEEFRSVSEASLDEASGLLRQIANAEMINLVQSRSDSEAGRPLVAYDGVGDVFPSLGPLVSRRSFLAAPARQPAQGQRACAGGLQCPARDECASENP